MQHPERTTIEPSLAWLLQPLAVQAFLDNVWTTTHHHVQRRCAGYFDTLLPAPSAGAELLDYFRQEPSAVRLMRGKDKKGPDSYRLDDGSLDLAGVRNDFADGYTIVLDGVERYCRPIGLLARSIEVELNFAAQVNAYITPPASRGLVPHYDDHDVLILQIQGFKRWHLYEGSEVPPHQLRRTHKAVARESLATPTVLRLEVGDVLYLPRGLVHDAETGAEPSIHLTVGIHASTVLTLAMAALQSLSCHDDRLNARLPPRHLDETGMQESLRALLRDAAASLEDPSAVARGLDGLADVLVRRGRCPPVGLIPHATSIDGETAVTKHHPLYSRVIAAVDGVALQFAQLSITAAADHQAALEFISRSTEPFRVRELPGLPATQQVELARTLIVSGFLTRLDGEGDSDADSSR